MKTILVTYDLVGTDETSSDYKKLIEHIRSYPNWANVARSVWIIKTNSSVSQVRDDLRSYQDADDRLFVAVLTGVAAWQNVICSNEWLLQNL